MSIKKIEEIKSNKFFKAGDIIVYAVIVVIIAVLFLSVFLTSDKSALSGIEISYYKDEYKDYVVIFSYSFESDTYDEIIYTENISVEPGEESLTVYFTTDDGDGHNTIYIDKAEVTVSVTESDCSNRKDCVYTSAIKDNSSSIVCSPHKLKIEPTDYSDDGQNFQVG